MGNFFIPADVPKHAEKLYKDNMSKITHDTGNLVLFSCDQKIEHLNDDFVGPTIHADAQSPEHLFRIAHQGTIGAMATHLGLIARYGMQYPGINYIVKLNAKTHLNAEHYDPYSAQLWDIDQIIEFKEQTKLAICGIGMTVYIGSEYESDMLAHAADAIYQAHQAGLVTIVWMYIRGKHIANEQDLALIAGAAGAANALGSDFVKIKSPQSKNQSTTQSLKNAIIAAGNTKVICAGGNINKPEQFLQELHEQIQSGAAGCATGRNIFQRSLPEAIAMTKAIAAIVLHNATAEKAFALYEQHK